MSNSRELLQAVIDSPDDDGPRFAYADWLVSQGETDRAEFVRIQCTLDRMSPADPRCPELQAREADLLERNGWTWAEEFGKDVVEWVYRRGFIERAGVNLERPADEIIAILNKSPIRHLRDYAQFCDLSGVVEALPHLEHLTGLEFWELYDVDDEYVANLLASPFLKNLRTLILQHDRNGNLIDDSVLVEGLASPLRANLQELAVNVDDMWRGPSAEVVMAIARSPYLSNLRKLNLSNTELTSELVQALGRSPAFSNLEALDLSYCGLNSEVWEQILQQPWLRRLKSIRLASARFVDGSNLHPKVQDSPRHRQAFESHVGAVDWDTEFVRPYYRNTSWSGLTWEDRQVYPLRAMNHLIRLRDYDGLEAKYRDLCQSLAGEEARSEIDGLPFDLYASNLKTAFEQALKTLVDRQGRSIFLRIWLRPDLEWRGQLDVEENEPHVAGGEVPEELSYQIAIAEYRLPNFPEAGQIIRRHPFDQGVLPSGPALYLLARTIAAFGRCLDAYQDLPASVYFSCAKAVFCMRRPQENQTRLVNSI